MKNLIFAVLIAVGSAFAARAEVAATITPAKYTLEQREAKFTWTIADETDVEYSTLQRSRFAEGPWTDVNERIYTGSDKEMVDTGAYAGIVYYYRIRCHFTNGEDDFSAPITCRKLRWLERSDASTLRPGVSLITSYCGNAFDGNTATFVDNGGEGNGDAYVGVTFTEPVYLAQVWYHGRSEGCRYRLNAARIKGGSDYAEIKATPDLLTDGMTQDSNLDGHKIIADPETRSAHTALAASGGAGWYGNVAEVCFFGWSMSDLAATPYPIYPSKLTAVNGDNSGEIALEWEGAINIDEYDIEYRVKGDENWTKAATGIGPTNAYLVTGLDNKTSYEFRVLASQGDEHGYSPVSEAYAYQLEPGEGTGLKGAVYGSLFERHIAHSAVVERFPEPVVPNFDYESSTLFTNDAASSALMILRGRLIVPVSGTYTFKLESAGTDGLAFDVNGSQRFNVSGSAGTKTTTVALEAGEVPISIDYRSVNSRRFLRLSWSLAGVWSERPVPASQLKPAADSEFTDGSAANMEGWRWTLSNAADNVSVIPRIDYLGNGGFRVRAPTGQSIGDSVFLTRPASGVFTNEFYIESIQNSSRAALYVADRSGYSPNSIWFIYTGSSRAIKSTTADLISPAWPGYPGGRTGMRLVREADRTLSFYMKNASRNGGEWELIQSLPNGRWSEKGIDLSDDVLRVGFSSSYNGGNVEISDLKLDVATQDYELAEVSMQAYANGSIMYAFPYSASRNGVIVQARRSAAEPWRTISGTFSKSYSSQNNYATWVCHTNFSGILHMRIANSWSGGQGSFGALDDMYCTTPVTGSILTSNGSLVPLAFNGQFDWADTQWTGYDFGKKVKISKIRYLFRFDTGVFGWSSRWSGSVFQVAEDAAFSSPSNIATIGTTGYKIGHMMEVTLPEPVETRYIRHYASSGFSSLMECEFYGEKPEFEVTLKTDDYSYYNTNLVFRWTVPGAANALSNCLERARTAEGPWTRVSPMLGPEDVPEFTDRDAYVGVPYFYRVRFWAGHPEVYGNEYSSDVMPVRRYRSLERDPEDINRLNGSGLTMIDTHEANCFDGNLDGSTQWVEFGGKNGGYVGFEFDEPVYVGSAWIVNRYTFDSSANGCVIKGAQSLDALKSDPVILTTSYTASNHQGLLKGIDPAAASYTWVAAHKSSGDWYANLTELMLFGWTDSDIEKAGLPAFPSVCSSLNGENAGDVVVHWSGGVNIETYDVQYRVKGADAWTTAVTDLAAAVASYTVTGLALNTDYQFRVVAHGRGESGCSPVSDTYCYQLVPGDGTGLRAYLFADIGRHDVKHEPYVEKRILASPEIDQNGGTLFTGADYTKCQIYMKGKLIAPLAGVYTLRFETAGSDGYQVSIDGVSKQDVSGSAGIRYTIITLSAGEHEIVIQYNQQNTLKLLHISWALENCWGDRTIPASQYKPAEISEMPLDQSLASLDGWTYSRPYGGIYSFPKITHPAPDTFSLGTDSSDCVESHIAYLTKDVRGAFTLEFTISAASGRPSLFVADANGSWASTLFFIYTGSTRAIKGGSGGDKISPAWPGYASGTTSMRLVRSEGEKTLRFYMKNASRNGGDWELIQTVTDGIWGGTNVSGRHLRVGFAQFFNASPSTITNLRLDNWRPGLTLGVR